MSFEEMNLIAFADDNGKRGLPSKGRPPKPAPQPKPPASKK